MAKNKKVSKQETNVEKKPKTTLKVGSSGKLTSRKEYDRGSKIKHRGEAINPADTFAYLVAKEKNNFYLFNEEYNIAKVFLAWEASLEHYFKAVIYRLVNDGNFKSIINNYKKEEDQVLNFYKKLYKITDSDIIESLEKTTKVTQNDLVNTLLEVKEEFKIAFNNEPIFRYKKERVDELFDELITDKKPETQTRLAALKRAMSALLQLRQEIVKDIQITDENISRADKILSLGMDGEFNNQTYLSLNKIVKMMDDPDYAQLTSEFIYKFSHSSFYKELGFYAESSIMLGIIEGLYECLDEDSKFFLQTDKDSIQTGQNVKGNSINTAINGGAHEVLLVFLSSLNRRTTTNAGKQMFTIDGVVPIGDGKETQTFRFDYKSYKGNKYSNQRETEKELKLGQLLDETVDIGGTAQAGRLLFANLIASKLVSSYLNQGSLLDTMVYYWLMIKEDGLAELFGQPGTSANFFIAGNKIIRFSTFLSSIFDPDTVIGTKKKNQITVDYREFKKDPSLLNIKNSVKQKFNNSSSLKKWSSHSEESYDLLYSDSAFAQANKNSVEFLKSQVVLKQKLTVNYKNLKL